MNRVAFVPFVALCAAFTAPGAPRAAVPSPADSSMADLGLTFTAPSATAANETFVWTFTVTNAGPDDAPSAQVSVPLPSGVTYVSSSSTSLSCAGTGGTVTCTAGAFPSMGSITAEVTVSAPATLTAVAANATATVSIPSMDATDSNNLNDTASVMTSVQPVDLSITKTDLVDPVTTSSALGYTLAVANAASVAAHNVVVTDDLPFGTSYVSANGTGWSCAFATGTLTCTRPEIDSSASATPAINVLLTAPIVPTTVQNTASVSATATDPNTLNDTSTAQTTVALPPPGASDVSVLVTGPMSAVDTGAAIAYTVSVANAGPDAAAGVQLIGSLPETAPFVSAAGTGWTCEHAGTTLTCTPAGALAVGAAPVITVTVTAPATAGTVSASFVVTSSTTDPSIANNTDNQATLVVDPSHPNLPPTITINGPISTLEDTPVSLDGAVVLDDPDSGSDEVELDVTATSCVLTLASTTGLTFLEGDGVLDPVLRVRGPVMALSTALAMGSVTPSRDYDGSASLALHMDDLGHTGTGGALTADATLSLVILPVDDPPTAGYDEVTVDANVTDTIDVLANDTIGQAGQTLGLGTVTQGAHGTVAAVDGMIAYTPVIGFVGDDAFTYTVTDGTVSAIGNVTVHVQAFTPPTPDRFTGGGCNTTGSRPDGALLALALAYWIVRRARNQSTCARSAANTGVG